MIALGTVGAGAASAHQPAGVQSAKTVKVVSLHRSMDKLWVDHVVWTREVIAAFAADSPALQPAMTRLLRNQTAIGNAMKPFYGRAAGNRLTTLLRTHIKLAVPVLQAAKAGDKQALKRALDDWYANGDQIAAFLSKANPVSWPLAATRSMMRAHLKLTTDEAAARLAGKWQADVAAYDRVREEILMMSDTLADGIVHQFPGRFS
jgi:hypothetical protein